MDDLKTILLSEEDIRRFEETGIFEYEGYSPENTFKVLSRKESNPKVLLEDLKTLLYYISLRGTKYEKATSKMSSEGKSIILAFVKKYGIQDRSPTKRDDITLSRISGIIPAYIAQLLYHNKGRIVGDAPSDFPGCLCFPGAPAIIPHDRQDLYDKWLQWSLSFNKIIQQGRNSEKVDMYGRIIWDSTYHSAAIRSKIMRSLHIE
jgi:hypothetical protein